MIKVFPRTISYRTLIIVLMCLFEGLLLSNQASANGQGPVGVWAVSERYALVADTSLPGLVLVDLETGVAIERLLMGKFRPVGVAVSYTHLTLPTIYSV